MNFRNKLGEYAGYFLNKIAPNQIQPYQFIENMHNIIYFSVFLSNWHKYEALYNYIKQIKENLFKQSIQTTKFVVKDIVQMPIQDENEKIKLLFSVCFLHYYIKFSYTKCDSFESFYTPDFIKLCNKFDIKIVHNNKFKVYCLAFFCGLKNELEHTELSLPSDEKNTNNISSPIHNNTLSNYLPNFQNFSNFKETVDQKIFQPIIQPIMATKVRMVDIVYSLQQNIKLPGYQNLFGNKNNQIAQNTSSSEISNESMTTNSNTNDTQNKMIIEENINEKESSNNLNGSTTQQPTLTNQHINFQAPFFANTNNITPNNSIFAPPNTIQNTPSDTPNISINENNTQPRKSAFENKLFSQRIINEINNGSLDYNAIKITELITSKIDLPTLKNLIKKLGFTSRVSTMVPFICSTTDILSSYFKELIPEIPDGYVCRFIFPERNTYLKAFEIYFTLYTLAGVDSNIFQQVTMIKFGLNSFDFNNPFIQCIVEFFSRITQELKSNENLIINRKTELECVKNIYDLFASEWQKNIIEKMRKMIPNNTLNG
ncbi:MAG: hypothetical protein MJ252_08680 [archaeon]|nr:hypothetical protein [archaeon]